MNLGEIPLFAMLKGRMGHLTQRQQVIAENVANASTPGFTARDIQPFSFQAQMQAQTLRPVAPAQTNAAHLAGTKPKSTNQAYKRVDSPDSETTLDGNQVVLEEQMMKMTEARMNYDAAVGFYQKSLNLIRMAARAPGR
jgi:flagellar basal-body rod protein FlgB